MGRHTWLVSGSPQQQAASPRCLTWSRAPLGLVLVNANCHDSGWKTLLFLPCLFLQHESDWISFLWGGSFFFFLRVFDILIDMMSTCHLPRLLSPLLSCRLAGKSLPFVLAICGREQRHPSVSSPSLHFSCLSKHMLGCHLFGPSRRGEKQLQGLHIVILCMKTLI